MESIFDLVIAEQREAATQRRPDAAWPRATSTRSTR